MRPFRKYQNKKYCTIINIKLYYCYYYFGTVANACVYSENGTANRSGFEWKWFPSAFISEYNNNVCIRHLEKEEREKKNKQQKFIETEKARIEYV